MSSLVPAHAQASPQPLPPENPFAEPSQLPFHAPPFDRIHIGDYEPAIEAGMRAERAEMDRIASNPAAPTFDNTLVAMERSGQLLARVMAVFRAVTGADTNPELQAIQKREAPRLAAHQDSILLDPRLFARVKQIYDTRSTLHLDPEAMRLVEVYYEEFVQAGAKLDAADQDKLKAINQQLSSLSNEFETRLLAATKAGALVVQDPASLAGMSDAELRAAEQAAKARQAAGYAVPLQNTTQQPALAELSNRAVRQQLLEHSLNRAERGDANDTREIVAHMAQLRAQKAKLLGYPNFAAWKLQDQMAKTPEKAIAFLDALAPKATAKAAEEQADIQALIAKQGASFTVTAADWEFYAEQVRRARYDLDEKQIKPYFELNRVLEDGVFYAAHQLYGISFHERKDLPVWNPDVRVFEVTDADGKPLALWYCDYYKRDNKNGGAWMSEFVSQSKLLGTLPVIYNVANLPKPATGEPALISYRDATTMFHEFGHALHGMFSNVEYPKLSGTNVARDFVEFPSQFNEHWALDPQVLSHYARNYKTGEPIPPALADKMRNSETFNQGYLLTELVAASSLDMAWHTLPADAPLEQVDSFELQALERAGLALPAVPPRYRSTYFSHIWASGYAAGYYAYQWAEMLDDNAFEWFTEHGGLTRANGERFRSMVLSRGNTEDLSTLYDNWLGKEPSIEPMLKSRGLAPQP